MNPKVRAFLICMNVAIVIGIVYMLQTTEVYDPPPKVSPEIVAAEAKYGPRPESEYPIKVYLESRARDPKSVEIHDCSGPHVLNGVGWAMGCDFRARNGFGGFNREFKWFVIRGGIVVQELDAREVKFSSGPAA